VAIFCGNAENDDKPSSKLSNNPTLLHALVDKLSYYWPVAIQPLLFAKPEIECAAAAKPGVSKWDHVWWNVK